MAYTQAVRVTGGHRSLKSRNNPVRLLGVSEGKHYYACCWGMGVQYAWEITEAEGSSPEEAFDGKPLGRFKKLGDCKQYFKYIIRDIKS